VNKRKERKKLNLNKLRTSLLFVVLVFFVCISLGFKVTAANFCENKGQPAYIEIIVKSGDSLWDLTQSYYQGNEDIRKIIYRIKDINKLESAEIYPGQLIKIPQV
jgi:LysM repeat protein